jgi:hypothetical protein
MVQGNILVFIFVGLILSILSFLFKQKESFNKVPKKIWSYWDNPDKIPKSVKLCMESWKKHNPDYEIILLNKYNYKGFITIPDEIRNHPHYNDSQARFSDLVRLYVLEEHGGIWIDASVLVKEGFDNWLFPKYAEFAGYYMKSITSDPKYPALESWFLAANKNSNFIKLWKQEFLEIGKFKDIQSYLDSRKKMGVIFDKIRDPHYLAIYISALKVFQIDKYPLDTLILRNSEDGPFKYLKDALWYPEKALKLACSNKEYQSPLMKMRSDERKILDEELDYSLSLDKCEWLN